MSNRSERREADREARKLAYRQLREARPQQQQPDPISESTNPMNLPNQIGSLKSIPVAMVPTEAQQIRARNALKHGCCSTATLILETESLDDFLALEARWFKGYAINPNNPDTQHEAELIRTAIRSDWFFLRADRHYAEVEARILEQAPEILMWGDAHHHCLQRFLRYRTAHSNTLAKHRKAIEDYRKNRTAELAQQQKLSHAAEKHGMAKERHDLFLKKNPPERTWDQELEWMKQEAIRLGFRPPDEPGQAG